MPFTPRGRCLASLFPTVRKLGNWRELAGKIRFLLVSCDSREANVYSKKVRKAKDGTFSWSSKCIRAESCTTWLTLRVDTLACPQMWASIGFCSIGAMLFLCCFEESLWKNKISLPTCASVGELHAESLSTQTSSPVSRSCKRPCNGTNVTFDTNDDPSQELLHSSNECVEESTAQCGAQNLSTELNLRIKMYGNLQIVDIESCWIFMNILFGSGQVVRYSGSQCLTGIWGVMCAAPSYHVLCPNHPQSFQRVQSEHVAFAAWEAAPWLMSQLEARVRVRFHWVFGFFV